MEKKYRSPRRDINLNSLLISNYLPATLKEWKSGWQIEFSALNPYSDRLERIRIRYQKIRKRIGNDTLARQQGKLYCDALNRKLESGWCPFSQPKTEPTKQFHKLNEILDLFLKEKEVDFSNGVFSFDSMRTYRSQIAILREWLLSNKKDRISIIQFNQDIANEYLDYIYYEKKLSPRTWNNYLKFLRTVWNWFIDKNYCTENVFQKIKAKVELEKQRVTIPKEWSSAIIKYFRENNPPMELVCGLIYNSFMRPAEICRTQISDIHLSKNGIYLPGTKTKNKYARWCLLPPHLIELLVKHKIDKYPSNYYLISTKLIPGKTPLNTRKLDKYWHKMREAINLPKEMQLYSLRDTGITDLKQQGHSNLFISSITGHRNSEEIETYTHEPDIQALKYIIDKANHL